MIRSADRTAFRYKSTKTARLRRTHWRDFGRWAFRIVKHRTTTSQPPGCISILLLSGIKKKTITIFFIARKIIQYLSDKQSLDCLFVEDMLKRNVIFFYLNVLIGYWFFINISSIGLHILLKKVCGILTINRKLFLLSALCWKQF